jgi:hypothetical protein
MRKRIITNAIVVATERAIGIPVGSTARAKFAHERGAHAFRPDPGCYLCRKPPPPSTRKPTAPPPEPLAEQALRAFHERERGKREADRIMAARLAFHRRLHATGRTGPSRDCGWCPASTDQR